MSELQPGDWVEVRIWAHGDGSSRLWLTGEVLQRRGRRVEVRLLDGAVLVTDVARCVPLPEQRAEQNGVASREQQDVGADQEDG